MANANLFAIPFLDTYPSKFRENQKRQTQLFSELQMCKAVEDTAAVLVQL